MFREGSTSASLDEESFKKIFIEYYPILLAYANKVISLEDSKEIVSEVFYQLWKNRESTEIYKSLSSYLFTSVRNRIINLHGCARVRLRQEVDEIPDILTSLNGEEILSLEKHVMKSINDLPDEIRDTFIMSRIQGKTYKEIAAEKGLSPKTIDSRIQKALKLLKLKLKDFLP